MNYALAQVRFTLAAPLTEFQRERLIEVPGLQPWHDYGRTVVAPYTAAWLCDRVLQRLAVQYTVHMPLVAPLADFTDPHVVAQQHAHLREAAVAHGVPDHWFTDFALPFQLTCAAFAFDRQRATVHAEPGSGKTFVAILAAVAMDRPVLWVTRGGATHQHEREWRRFTTWDVLERRPPSREKKSVEGYRQFVDSRAATGRFAVLVSWDMLTEWEDELCADVLRGKWTVIFDEAHLAKTAKRSKWLEAEAGARSALQEIKLKNTSAAAYRIACAAKNVCCTTATPVANALIDLWGQLTLVEPYAWGKTDNRFAKYHCDAHKGEYGWVKKGITRATLEDLQGRMNFSTIRIPYDVSHAELPPKRRMVVRVRLEDQIAEATGHGKELRKLQKLADGGDEIASHGAHRMHLARAASRKRSFVAASLKEYASTGNGKIVVFTGWRDDCEYLGKQLEKLDGVKVWVSHGADSHTERKRIQDEYMAHPGPCVLVGTWQAWGESIDLSDSDVIAFAMLPYTPREVAQGEGRGDRLNMKRKLLYLYFVADGTIDEQVAHLLTTKLEAVDAVTSGNRLSAFGGLRDTMLSLDDSTVDDLVARMAADEDKDSEDG